MRKELNYKELCNKAQNGDEKALEIICDRCSKMVYSYVNTVSDKYYYYNLERDDLIQTGMIGLFKAIMKFNTNIHTHFLTYATVYIRNNIDRYIRNQAFMIHVPGLLFESFDEDFYTYMPYELDDEIIESYDENYNYDIKEEIDHMILKDAISQILLELTDREEKVIRLRFGLDDGYTRTLRETAKEFNVTPSRIREIEIKAIRKLKHPYRRRILRMLYE